MSDEQEDLNAFNAWDCFGATLMLGVTPGIIHFATTEPHDKAGAIGIGVVGVVIALIVLGVALITRWRLLGKIINIAGTGITIYFIIHMTLFWVTSCEKFARERSLNLPSAAQTQK